MVVRAKLFSPLTLSALVVVLMRLMSRPALASTLLSPTMAPPRLLISVRAFRLTSAP